MMVKGVVLGRLGRVGESEEWLLREGEEGWLGKMPDLIYYY